MKAEGWAVVTDGAIQVKTVSPTRRAAIVNWITVRAGTVLWDSHTDQMIEDLWTRLAPKYNAAVIEVVIVGVPET